MLHYPIGIREAVTARAHGVVAQREAQIQPDGHEQRQKMENSLQRQTALFTLPFKAQTLKTYPRFELGGHVNEHDKDAR